MTAKAISFVNMKGGVGKTTLTINIGNQLAKEGHKVLIVDMDPQFNATQSLLLYKTRIDRCLNINEANEEDIVKQEISSTKDYKQLSEHKQTVLQIFESSNIDSPLSNPSLAQRIIDNLFLIPGDLMLAKEISGDTANKVGALMGHLNNTNIVNDYEYILIDCPPTWSILTHSSLFASDFYVIPSKVDLYSEIGIELLENQIREKITKDPVYTMLSYKNIKRLGIIFTLVYRTVKAEEERKNYLKEKFPTIDFFETDIPNFPSVPTKFIMYDEIKHDSKYIQLTNSIEKITSELVSKIRREDE